MIAAEWTKQWHRRRTTVLLAAAAAFPVVMTIALKIAGSGSNNQVGDLPLLIVPDRSGLSVPLIALSSTMRFFLPLLVAILVGEVVAGEAAAGSLRYALARPVSRTRLLAAKAAVSAGITVIAVTVLAIASVIVGLAAFGWHSLPVANGDPAATGVVLAHFSAWSALGKLAVSSAYVTGGMLSVLAFGLFLSVLTKRPIVAVAGAAALSVVSRVFNSDYLPGVGAVSRYMPNQDIDLWQQLFVHGAGTTGMGRFLALQVAYGAVFLVAAWWLFTRRDVLA
ncbi:MAG: ABC transporter permease subunit [Acidimicrobiales bacterium]